MKEARRKRVSSAVVGRVWDAEVRPSAGNGLNTEQTVLYISTFVSKSWNLAVGCLSNTGR